MGTLSKNLISLVLRRHEVFSSHNLIFPYCNFWKLAECQYYDSRGIWGVAIDAIVQNTRVQASAAAAQRQLIQDCTNNGYCGYGAYCFQSGDQVGCACKSGFRGRTRYGVEAVCSRIY